MYLFKVIILKISVVVNHYCSKHSLISYFVRNTTEEKLAYLFTAQPNKVACGWPVTCNASSDRSLWLLLVVPLFPAIFE